MRVVLTVVRFESVVLGFATPGGSELSAMVLVRLKLAKAWTPPGVYAKA